MYQDTLDAIFHVSAKMTQYGIQLLLGVALGGEHGLEGWEGFFVGDCHDDNKLIVVVFVVIV